MKLQSQFDARTLNLAPVDHILRETEAFFMKEGKVYTALKQLAHDLEEESIPYVVIEGMALNLWGYTRQTIDVDILLTPEGLESFKDRFIGRGYVPAFAGASRAFKEAETQVRIEVLTTGEYPEMASLNPLLFPILKTLLLTVMAIRLLL